MPKRKAGLYSRPAVPQAELQLTSTRVCTRQRPHPLLWACGIAMHTGPDHGHFPKVWPRLLYRRVKQQIVAVNDFRIMGIAQDGRHFMTLEPHDAA